MYMLIIYIEKFFLKFENFSEKFLFLGQNQLMPSKLDLLFRTKFEKNKGGFSINHQILSIFPIIEKKKIWSFARKTLQNCFSRFGKIRMWDQLTEVGSVSWVLTDQI